MFALRTELAAAEDAAQIEARLEVQRGRLDRLAVVGTSANPQADVLSWLSAGLLAAEVWERLLTVFVAGLIELSAAMGLAITARSVVELLAPRMPVATPPEAAAPQVREPAPMASIEPEVGWRMWFERCVAAAKGSRVRAPDAYAHYEQWAAMAGIGGVLPLVTFGRRMSDSLESVGGRTGHSNGRVYEGISLADLGAKGQSIMDQEAGE